jgi:DNA-binding NtrC family response regulator
MPDPSVPPPPHRILVIDDEDDVRESLHALLTSEGFAVDLAANATGGLKQLERPIYDLILVDLMMPDKSGIELIEELRQRDRETPIFLITAYGSIEVAVKAIKAGANDYFSKPWDNEKLLIEIRRMIAAARLARENLELRRALKQRYRFENIAGKSDRLARVLDLAAQVAGTRSAVLISGEPGTGKEVVAKAIHASSPRAERPFVAVYSASMPAGVIESSVFASLRDAHGGTLFIDEIAALPPETQATLVRVIQDREFRPPGAAEPIPIDARVVAATHADLRKMVEEGRFREDLHYRLNVVHIALPALRERKEDIPLLVEHFFGRYCRENGKLLDADGRPQLRFEPEAMQILMEYNWPGNVRELENVVERAVVLASGPVAGTDLLPEHILLAGGVRIRQDESAPLPADASLFELVADFERSTILQHLERCNWSQTETAEVLRVPLSTLNQKIKRLQIDVKKRSTV